jgi:hypothetical protein
MRMIYLGTDRVMEDILEEHVETLRFLWGRRCAELRGAGVRPRAFADLEDRILAHTDGIVLEGPDAVPRLQEGLAGEEISISLASGYALLCMGDAGAARLVVEASRDASGPALEGLSRALSYGSLDLVGPELREIASSGSVLPASAAAEAFAFHGEVDVAARRIGEFLKCDQAAVRRTAWRIISLIDGVPGGPSAQIPASFEAYEPGLRDEDPAVWRQVLETAAWTRQPWLLSYCRRVSCDPSPDRLPVIRLLSVLGEPVDLDLMLAAGSATSLGLTRFKVLAAFGHPSGMEALLEGIRSEDPSVAVAAASAYSAITGAEIDSEKRVKLPPPGVTPPDEFETEFLDEVFLPDAEKADAHRARTREIFTRGVRWRSGIDVSHAAPPRLSDSLDNESRWDACLRARYRGIWQGTLRDLEGFPLGPWRS